MHPRRNKPAGSDGAFMNILNYQAAVFDFDGTIIDSMNMWTEIDVEYLARYGHEFSASLQNEIEGMSADEMAVYFREKYGIPRTNEEMIREWVEMSEYKYLHELRLKPFAKEFIGYLHQNGIKVAVATSTEKCIIEPCLRKRGILDLFDGITTTTECGIGKPAPDVFLLAASRIGADPSGCVAFEDLPAGILSARRAGMFTVAVDDSFSREKEAEKRALSDYFIYDFSELMPKETE